MMKPVMKLRPHKRRLIYLALIVGIGGLGFWITGCQHLLNPTALSGFSFCDNLATFSISLAVMAFADHLVISQNNFQPTGALGRFAIMALAVASGVVPLVLKHGIGIISSWISFFLALGIWWCVHATNQTLDDQGSPQSALGGELAP